MAVTDHQRVKSQLSEAITIFCKSILSYQSEFCIEGLLGITIDSNQVLLISIHEAVASGSNTTLSTLPVDSQSLPPTILLMTTPSVVPPEQSVVHVTHGTPISAADFSQTVTLFEIGGLLKDSGIVAETEMTDDRTSDIVANIVECESTATKDNSTNNIAITNENSYSELDSVPRSSLFTSAELDEFIVSVGQCPPQETAESSNDGFVASAKNDIQTMVTDSSESNSCSVIVVGPADENDSLLLPSDADDQIPGCLSWDDDDLSDIGPLNLAGPQDLSTGLGKKKFACATCGRCFESEKELSKHDCKDQTDAVSDDGLFSTMPEPLNLISRPLDLTIGVRMGDEDDDDPESVYGMLMTAGMASAAAAAAAAAAGSVPSSVDQRLACICGKTFDAAEPFASHIASCAKSKMTPYKTCETCGKVLFSNSGYMKHRRLHAGAYKYRCGVCRQGFFDQTNLRAHADSRHSKVRRYACPRCDKSFYWKHHVKRHMDSCGTAVAGPDAGDVDATAAPLAAGGDESDAGAQRTTIDTATM